MAKPNLPVTAAIRVLREHGITRLYTLPYEQLVAKGYPAGIKQKILSGTLDMANRQGGHTRLLKFEPGTYTTVPFEHDYWEEVFVIEGDLWVGNEGPAGGERFGQYTYCVRPPHVAQLPRRLVYDLAQISYVRAGSGERQYQPVRQPRILLRRHGRHE